MQGKVLAGGALALVGASLLMLSATNSQGARSLLSSSTSSSSSSGASTPTWLDFSAKESSDFLVTNQNADGLPDKCNPLKRVSNLVDAFNDGRFEDVVQYFTHDALRFVNGVLDPASNGRPYSAEQWQSLRAKMPMRWTVSSVTRSGDWAVAVTGSFSFGGSIEAARATGVGLVFEFRHSDRCLIQVERVYHGHDSEAFGRFAPAACEVFEPLRLTPACGSTAADDAIPLVDLRARLETCWGYVENRQPGQIAGCFAPNAVVIDNGVESDVDFSSAAVWQAYFQSEHISDVTILDAHVDGLRVNAYIRYNLIDPNDNDNVARNVHIFQALHFNAGGEVVKYEYNDEYATAVFTRRTQGLGPDLSEWSTANIDNLVVDAVRLFGWPTTSTNSRRGDASVEWLSTSSTTPVDGVSLMDAATAMSVNGRTYQLRFWCSAPMTIAPLSMADEVRAISESIVYDTLAQKVWSKGSTASHCLANLHMAARVATGTTDAASTRLNYVANVERVSDIDSAEFNTMLSELRSLLA